MHIMKYINKNIDNRCKYPIENIDLDRGNMSQAEKAGWLLNQSTGQAVWCAVSEGSLFIYSNKRKESLVQKLYLPSCEVELSNIDSEDCVTSQALKISSDITKCSFCFLTSSNNELLSWLSTLEKASEQTPINVAGKVMEEISVITDNNNNTTARNVLPSYYYPSNNKTSKDHVAALSELGRSQLTQKISVGKLHAKSQSCSNLLLNSDGTLSESNLKKSLSEKNLLQDDRIIKLNSSTMFTFTSGLFRKAALLKDRFFRPKQNNTDIYLATLINVKKSGYLFHKTFLKWQMLWCVIAKNHFYTFKSKEVFEKPILVLPLISSSVVYIPFMKEKQRSLRRRCFRITTITNKSVYFASASDADLCKWIQVLHMTSCGIYSDSNDLNGKFQLSSDYPSYMKDCDIFPFNNEMPSVLSHSGLDSPMIYSQTPKYFHFDNISVGSTCGSSTIDRFETNSLNFEEGDHYDSALRHVWEKDESYRIRRLRARIRKQRLAGLMDRSTTLDNKLRSNVLILQENGRNYDKCFSSSGSSAIVTSTEDETSSNSELESSELSDPGERSNKPVKVRAVPVQSLSPLDCSGYLEKRQLNGSWIRFWYALKNANLYCYLSDDDEVTVDILYLKDWKISKDISSSEKPNVLQLSHVRWAWQYLNASSNRELQFWFHVMQRAATNESDSRDGDSSSGSKDEVKRQKSNATARDSNTKRILQLKTSDFSGSLSKENVAKGSLLSSESLNVHKQCRKDSQEKLLKLAKQYSIEFAEQRNIESPQAFGTGPNFMSTQLVNWNEGDDVNMLQIRKRWIKERMEILHKNLRNITTTSIKGSHLFPFNRSSKNDRLTKHSIKKELNNLDEMLEKIDNEIRFKITLDNSKTSIPVNASITKSVPINNNGQAHGLGRDPQFNDKPSKYTQEFEPKNFRHKKHTTVKKSNAGLRSKHSKYKSDSAILAFPSETNDFHRTDEVRDLRECQMPQAAFPIREYELDTSSSSDISLVVVTENNVTQTDGDPPERNDLRQISSEIIEDIMNYTSDPCISRDGSVVYERCTQTLFSTFLLDDNGAFLDIVSESNHL